MTRMDALEQISKHDFQADIDAIAGIAAVPRILDLVCRTTGMGFAAVARVTPERWVACEVQDNADFGLKPGGELKVETTLCHEIRQSGRAIVFDNADDDLRYATHHTPAIYGLKTGRAGTGRAGRNTRTKASANRNDPTASRSRWYR